MAAVSVEASTVAWSKALFDRNVLLWSSKRATTYSWSNKSMLQLVRCTQYAKSMNGMLDKISYCKPQNSAFKAGAGTEFTEEVKEVYLEDEKKALIRAVANTNRGKDTTPKQRKHILKMINELENVNPTKDPIYSPFLSGYWSLLYTAPVDENTVDKYAGTQEGPFLARIKPLAFGSIKQSRSFQVIDIKQGKAKNMADFRFFGKDGTLTIKGKAAPSSVNGKETVRLDVVFEEFWVRVGGWTSPKVSLTWINPQGWVDTTYLDKDMRVGRGDKGSVFVSVRVKSEGL